MSVFDNNRTKCFIFVTWEELSTTYFVLSAVNGVFSVIAATLNALILLTVLKSPSLRTPSYIFLCNLAISDLAVGVCIQPLCSAVMALQGLGVMAKHCTLVGAFSVLCIYFAGISFIGVSLMNCDLYLALYLNLKYVWIVTVPRSILLTITSWISLAVYSVLWVFVFKWGETFAFVTLGIILFFVLLNVVAYLKIYRVIRRHRRQIQVQSLAVSETSDGTNTMRRNRKSVKGTFYVFLLFLFCYVPYILCSGLVFFLGLNEWLERAVQVSVTIIFLNSSLNPLLYCWKRKDLRENVKRVIKELIPSHLT
ncbi:adrenocorticotropic hormone receptor-like [Nematostella vectensis]|uniref:adrenocorticotropic hormone receptor-like n=1 Tax=Nematostella vectensis TaxID=45351 RepID=UPI0013902A1B|nr:adrenocorticotropic hormone receptor-like [Nematostella vectensis]